VVVRSRGQIRGTEGPPDAAPARIECTVSCRPGAWVEPGRAVADEKLAVPAQERVRAHLGPARDVPAFSVVPLRWPETAELVVQPTRILGAGLLCVLIAC
jgi:hypothetical protein